jgi:hypothetical protein
MRDPKSRRKGRDRVGTPLTLVGMCVRPYNVPILFLIDGIS